MPKPIQVFSRHCYFSHASAFKGRPALFKRENCLVNLVGTAEKDLVDVHFVYDAHAGDISRHYLAGVPNVHIFDAGTEAKAFLALLDYIFAMGDGFNDNTIIYVVEDDYLHRPGWCHVLLDGLNMEDASYVTLYDHPDKYTPYYEQLTSRIRIGRHCHWRTTPSTTNTFATRFSVLQKDLDLHRASATDCHVSRDHDRYQALTTERQRVLYSSIPGFSTHVDNTQLAPFTDWERLSSAYSLAAKLPAADQPRTST